MPRKGHSDEQIVYALRQAEAGKKVGDICREMGVSQQAFYSWKKRYAGVGVSELRELRQLREENLCVVKTISGPELQSSECCEFRRQNGITRGLLIAQSLPETRCAASPVHKSPT